MPDRKGRACRICAGKRSCTYRCDSCVKRINAYNTSLPPVRVPALNCIDTYYMVICYELLGMNPRGAECGAERILTPLKTPRNQPSRSMPEARPAAISPEKDTDGIRDLPCRGRSLSLGSLKTAAPPPATRRYLIRAAMYDRRDTKYVLRANSCEIRSAREGI